MTESPQTLPSIAFDDDWITVNGVSFSSEPRIGEITALLGQPDETVTTTQRTHYCWSRFGIAATSPYKDERDPDNEARASRVSTLRLIIQPDPTTVFESWDIGSSLSRPSELRPFTGNLSICGSDFKKGYTAEEMASVKSGRGIKIQANQNSWACTPVGVICQLCIAVTGSRSVNTSRNEPVALIDLNFERWHEPSSDFQRLSLAPRERILNAVTTEPYKGISFGAVITTQRLLVVASTLPAMKEWRLEASPQIIWEGGVRIPPQQSELIAFVGGLSFVAAFGWGGYCLWPGVWASICLCVCGFLTLVSSAMAQDMWFGRTRRHFAVQLRIKSSSTDDVVVQFYDGIRFSPSPVAGLIHRLGCEVSRIPAAHPAPKLPSMQQNTEIAEAIGELAKAIPTLKPASPFDHGRMSYHGQEVAKLEWRWYPIILKWLVIAIILVVLYLLIR